MIPKFRAWDIDGEQMLYTEEDLVVEFFDEGVVITDHTTFSSACMDIDNFELMQSTGLKDKNGTEIYEGDIVEYKYPYDKRMKSLGDIVWSSDKACFAINMQESTEKYELYRITAGNYLKVIGNIFQHPNLLEADSHE